MDTYNPFTFFSGEHPESTVGDYIRSLDNEALVEWLCRELTNEDPAVIKEWINTPFSSYYVHKEGNV